MTGTIYFNFGDAPILQPQPHCLPAVPIDSGFMRTVATFIQGYPLKIFLMFIYFRERERAQARAGRAEREGDTESEAGSRLRALSTEPDAGLEPMNCEIMTCPELDI